MGGTKERHAAAGVAAHEVRIHDVVRENRCADGAPCQGEGREARPPSERQGGPLSREVDARLPPGSSSKGRRRCACVCRGGSPRPPQTTSVDLARAQLALPRGVARGLPERVTRRPSWYARPSSAVRSRTWKHARSPWCCRGLASRWSPRRACRRGRVHRTRPRVVWRNVGPGELVAAERQRHDQRPERATAPISASTSQPILPKST